MRSKFGSLGISVVDTRITPKSCPLSREILKNRYGMNFPIWFWTIIQLLDICIETGFFTIKYYLRKWFYVP
jgi:hypothetical protein